MHRIGTRAAAAALVVGGAVSFGTTAFLEQGCVKEAPKASAEDPIIVGVSLGLTNDLKSFSAPLRDAVRAAEGEINAGGGLLGRQVRFDVEDDRSDEGTHVTGLAQRFADRNVAAVIGPVSSGQVKLTQQIFADQQIIQISPAATSVELTTAQPLGDRFLFRTTPADDFQGAAVILFAARTPRGLGDAGAPAPSGDGGVAPASTCNRLALVYIDNPYGTSMAKVVADNFPKRGTPGQRSIASQQKIPLEARANYEDIIPGIVASDPDCLALIAYEKAAAQFVKDFKKAPGYPALAQRGFFFIGTDGVFTQGFLDLSLQDPSNEASVSSAEGVYGTNPDTQPGTTEYNAFKTIYGAYFPLGTAVDAPAFAANTFDAAILIAFAIQKAGSATDRIAIRDALTEVSKPGGRPVSPSEIGDGLAELRNGGDIDYKGASGNVDFDESGNVNGGFIIWQAVREEPSKAVTYKTVARFTTEELVEQVK
ncbi:MAG: Branched-chain amino acid transporter, amino acid-binding protein [Labilithrix sp.]|nr:Branched-chain amino acid transporter, amino acid-binding protein [Labilithrix sp.]